MSVKIEAYQTVVRDAGCPRCGQGKSWTALGPDGVEGSTSYSQEGDAEHEVDILNHAFQAGRDSILEMQRAAVKVEKPHDPYREVGMDHKVD